MLCGIVDIGANTIRLSIYDCPKDQEVRRLMHKRFMAGLASYIENGLMSDHGVALTCETLNVCREILSNLSIPTLYVFATAPFRNIQNTAAVLSRILAETGIVVEVLSWEEEATLGFVGATHDTAAAQGVVVDIGGGSTELTVYEDKKVQTIGSIPLGSLNLYKGYVKELLPTAAECREMASYCQEALIGLAGLELAKGPQTICGIGGAIRATNALNNQIYELPSRNSLVPAENVGRLLELYHTAPKYFIKKAVQIVPDRSHTVVPGMILLQSLIQTLGCTAVQIGSYGVREGYLFQRVLQEGSAVGNDLLAMGQAHG